MSDVQDLKQGRLASLARSGVGLIDFFRIKLLRQKVLFHDQFGFKYWLDSMTDNPRWCRRRRAIGDSIGVTRYILQSVESGQCCVDVGAHQGGISVPMWSKCGTEGRVLSIEADPGKIERIKRNLRLNGYPDDCVINLAMSEKEEFRGLRCYKGASGWSTFGSASFAEGKKSYVIDVKCVTGDDLFVKHGIDKVDLVKLDIEGAELYALRGLRSFLSRGKIRRIIFEVNPFMLRGLELSVRELIDFWADYPYEIQKIAEHGKCIPLPEKWSEYEVGDCIAELTS